MKKILLISLILLALKTSASVHTVNNVPNGGAQFTTIQAAIDAAAQGDTIFIQGSPIAYPVFTLASKKIAFFGPGWSPDKNLPVRAEINGVTVQNDASSGSEFNGLVLKGGLDIPNSVNDLKFIRCEFKGGASINGSANNWLIEGCYISGGVARFAFNAGLNYTNILFHNNVFRTNGFASIYGLANATGVLIDHNLFYLESPAVTNLGVFDNNCRFLTITNNVFVNVNASTQLSLSTFNNNILFYPSIAAQSAPWTVNNNINGGGNVNGINPQLSAQTAVNAGTDNPLLDFTIATGPANSSGSDGKDMGLLFDETGSLNWNASRMSRLPVVTSMNITNPTIAPAGTLNVEVTAKKSN